MKAILYAAKQTYSNRIEMSEERDRDKKRMKIFLSYHLLLSSSSLIFDNTGVILGIFLFAHLVSSNEYSYIHIHGNISSLPVIKRTIWKHLLPG